MDTSLAARFYMIKSQLMPGRVLDEKIINALYNTPREMFVPEAYSEASYVDEDIPLCQGRYLMEPLTFAHLIELAEIHPQDQVLIIACGTGYSAAVLSKLCGKVTAVEEQKELGEKARQILQKLKIQNVEIFTASHTLGAPGSQIFNSIIIEGAIEQLPDSLSAQLAEGGKIVTVEKISSRPGDKRGLGKAVMFRKQAGTLSKRVFFDASVPLLPGFEKKQNFIF
jgi:protein-L-isoaspartate(D-aspartate) O-methyltransferase